MGQLSLQEILSLEKVETEHALHYVQNGRAVASIFKATEKLGFSAFMGDDDNTVPFAFEYSGPVAILYHSPVDLGDQPPLAANGCVIAVMSAVCFGNIALLQSSSIILPTTIGQYDIGDPEKFELARELICSYTGEDWGENYLQTQYHEYTVQLDRFMHKQNGRLA